MQYLQRFDVILLSETRCMAWDDAFLPDHSVALVPACRDGQAGEGLLLAVRRHHAYHVQDWASDDTSIWVKLKFQDSCRPLMLGCCYVPPAGSPQLRSTDLSARFTSLGAMAVAAICEGDVFLAGDFNARVGQLHDTLDADFALRGCTDVGVNGHGHRLIELCKQSGLMLCTGRVAGDEFAVSTFKARRNSAASRPDHVLVSQGVLQCLQTSVVDTERRDSDHYPIETVLRLTASTPAPVCCGGRPLSRLQWQSSAQNRYVAALGSVAADCLLACEDAALAGDVCTAFAALEEGMLRAAAAGGMRMRAGRANHAGRTHQPFFDAECQALKRGVRISAQQGVEPAALRAMERHYHSVVRSKRRAHRVQQLKVLISAQKEDPRRFWKTLRSQHSRLPVQLSQVQQWDPYLHKVADIQLPELPPGLPHASYPQCPTQLAAELNAPFTLAEVLCGLKKLHNGRAQGPQGYPAELLRYAESLATCDEPLPVHVLAPAILKVFNAAFQACQVPRILNGSLVTPVFKSGNRVDTSNYRPIAVTNPFMRLYAGMLNARLLKFTEDNNLRAPSQAGFRPRLSTVHQLFTLQHFIDHQRAQKQPLFCCFVDLKGAYERVSRPLLWEALKRLGISGQMLGAVQSLYENSDVSMNIEGKTGQQLPSKTGVKQGCPLSPTLFGLLLDGLHRHLKVSCPDAGLEVHNGLRVAELGYADDFVLLASSANELQKLIDATAEFCAFIGMIVSTEKTKVLVFSTHHPGPLQWSCAGQPLHWVSEFKYLGITFSSTDGCHKTYAPLHQRSWAAWALLQRQYGQLKCATSVALLLHLYDVCVPPTASYGCEVWGVRRLGGDLQKARAQLESAHVKMLRQIAGVRTSAPTAILFKELEMRPLVHVWWQRTVQFWNNLAAAPPNSLHHQVALADCRDAVLHGVHNWASGVMHGLRLLGYQFTIRCDRLDTIDGARVQELLDEAGAAAWQALDVCPRTCPHQRSQFCTYLRWFAKPAGLPRSGSLVQLPVSARCLRTLLRFRVGCHGLPKDLGRRSGVPRLQRVCQKCDLHEIGDEHHLVFTCTAVQHVRERYVGLFSPSIVTMLDFMWQPDLVGVANFVKECFDVIYADAHVRSDRTSHQPLMAGTM